MESSGRGYEFLAMENRVRTAHPPLSLSDKLKVKLGIKKVQPVITKSVFTNRWYVADLKYITCIGEVRNENGKTYNTRCAVFSAPENNWVTIKGRFSDIKDLLDNRFEHKNTIKGYGR